MDSVSLSCCFPFSRPATPVLMVPVSLLLPPAPSSFPSPQSGTECYFAYRFYRSLDCVEPFRAVSCPPECTSGCLLEASLCSVLFSRRALGQCCPLSGSRVHHGTSEPVPASPAAPERSGRGRAGCVRVWPVVRGSLPHTPVLSRHLRRRLPTPGATEHHSPRPFLGPLGRTQTAGIPVTGPKSQRLPPPSRVPPRAPVPVACTRTGPRVQPRPSYRNGAPRADPGSVPQSLVRSRGHVESPAVPNSRGRGRGPTAKLGRGGTGLGQGAPATVPRASGWAVLCGRDVPAGGCSWQSPHGQRVRPGFLLRAGHPPGPWASPGGGHGHALLRGPLSIPVPGLPAPHDTPSPALLSRAHLLNTVYSQG